ncbi:aminoglycoside phosphotransferase family protein [Paenibacillus sp. sptzw28]|uniref:phosphotransferase family protein n=1 Tax=Paenibacillus sp. sptzw28 TaxID=715179 RepID=UPI001C6F004E|nr:aminoglycoside phosphotransferase family protein [Paenibacillus sp. sptzw28]QYR23615.1 aminoglycoside phosphotransferase family protein [Paenibacillus sp. sptzw28]
MESGIKNKLDAKQLKAVIRQVFNESVQEARELSDGWANTAYSILLGSGRKVVLKAAPVKDTKVMRYENNIMTAEVMAMKLIGGKDILPVPRIYAHDDSFSILNSEYFIMEYLEGEPLNKIRDSLSMEETASIQYELGVCNRRLNEIEGSQFGYFGQVNRTGNGWKETFCKMLLDVLADGRDAGVELPVDYSQIERELHGASDVLSGVQRPYFVHWDLWDGNIFINDGRISGIIDFERAIWGDPLMEFYFSHFAKPEPFLEGYGQSAFSQEELARRALYDLYLDLILVIECPYRHYEDDNHIKWAYQNMETGWSRFLHSLG